MIFYPTQISKNSLKKNFKFIYVSENKEITNFKSLEIWEKNKQKILENLQLVDQLSFWKNIVNIENDPVHEIYKDIKSLIRADPVDELNKILRNYFLLFGSDWKKKYPNALESNYSIKYIENMYKGNICIDFGSKNSEKCIYPRSCKIVESGGLLFQSIHKDSKIYLKIYSHKLALLLYRYEKKIDFFLKNPNKLDSLFVTQQKNFETEDLNYKTIQKIENFIN